MATSVIMKTSKLTAQAQRCVAAGAVGAVAGRRGFTTQLTEEQRGVQEVARRFANTALRPVAGDLDQQGRFPYQQIKQLSELGLMSVCMERQWGGLGLDYLSLAVAVEELSRGCASTGMIAAIHNFLFVNLLSEKGTDKQKERFLPEVAKGAIGCFALSEPGAGSDAAGISTLAVRARGGWRLRGRKAWVTSAIEGAAAAVLASADPAARRASLVCFLVPLDAEGVFRGKKEPLMGVRAASASDVRLEDVWVPDDMVLGKPGDGWRLAMAQLDQARVGIAAHATGIAQAALDTAIQHAKERIAFGKPLTRMHSVQDRLAEMSLLVQTSRLLTYRAASDLCTAHSAAAKYVAARHASAAADHCLQILGARGLAASHSAQRHYRDARGTQIYGGVTDVQKRLVAHHLLKEYDAL